MILNIIMADNTRTWKRRTTSSLRARERVKEQHCAQASLPVFVFRFQYLIDQIETICRAVKEQQCALCRGQQNILTLENVLFGWRPKYGTSPTHSL